MNIDGEHLSYEQVHEILNWRLFSPLSLSRARLFVLLLQQRRTPVSLALPTIIVVVVDVHLSCN